MNFPSLTSPRPLLYRGGREIGGLQVLKFLGVLLVIHIHTAPPYYAWIEWLCRAAVPFFFMITGYFLPDADGVVRAERLRRTLVKILRIAVVANVAYIAVSVVSRLLRHSPDIAVYGTVGYWVELLLFGINGAGHLWYLTALIFSVLIIMLCVRLRCTALLFALIPAGLLLNLALGSYGFLWLDSAAAFSWSRNAITTGVPFIMLGVQVRYNEHRIPRGAVMLAVAALVAACAVAEYMFVDKINLFGDMFLFTVPLAAVLFVLFMRLDASRGWLGVFARWGALYSLDLYVWHILFFGVVYHAHGMLEFSGVADALAVTALTAMFIAVVRGAGVRRVYARG